MTYFPDLSNYQYMKTYKPELVKNIGWLAKGVSFPTGKIPKLAFDVLISMLDEPVQCTRGLHTCEICEIQGPHYYHKDGASYQLGSAELRVFSPWGTVYACPTLVVHYIADHDYLPPQEFVEALVSGPFPSTQEYSVRLQAIGEARSKYDRIDG